MLVLTRKRDQRLVVSIAGYTFNIHVLDVRGSKVCLGVDAPQEVVVHRDEIWQRILLENRSLEQFPASS